MNDDFTSPPLSRTMIIKLVRRSAADQMRYALEQIRDQAATKENGGAWAAGVAVLCLATLPLDDGQ